MQRIATICRAVIVCALLSGLLSGLGCERRASRQAAPDPPLRVTASVYALADVARDLGGRHVSVLWVLERGQPLEGFQPSPGQANVLRNADLLVTGGASEPWAVEGFADAVRSDRFVRMDLLETGRDQPHGAALWLDPLLGKALIGELAQRFSLMRPNQVAEFQESRRRLEGELDALWNEYAPQLTGVKDQRVLVLSGVYDALLARVGIQPICPIELPPQKLGEMEFIQLRRVAAEKQVRFILLDTSTPEALRRWVVEKIGLKTVEIELLGSSSPTLGVDSYVRICRHNLQELRKLSPAASTQ